MGLWDNLKDKWNQFTGKSPVDHVAEQRRRRKLRESINDPDDLFLTTRCWTAKSLRVSRASAGTATLSGAAIIFSAPYSERP